MSLPIPFERLSVAFWLDDNLDPTQLPNLSMHAPVNPDGRIAIGVELKKDAPDHRLATLAFTAIGLDMLELSVKDGDRIGFFSTDGGAPQQTPTTRGITLQRLSDKPRDEHGRYPWIATFGDTTDPANADTPRQVQEGLVIVGCVNVLERACLKVLRAQQTSPAPSAPSVPSRLLKAS